MIQPVLIRGIAVRCEQYGAAADQLSPSVVLACHCGTTERSPFVLIPHSAIAAVKLLNVKQSQ